MKYRKGLRSPFWNISSCTGCSCTGCFCTGCFCTGCFCGGSAASAVLAAAAFSGPGNEPLETAHNWAGRSPQQALNRTTLNTLQPCYWTFSAASTQQDNSQYITTVLLDFLRSKHSTGQLSIHYNLVTGLSPQQALNRTTLKTLQPCYWTFSAASTQQDNSQYITTVLLDFLRSKHSTGQLSTQACYWTERSPQQALSRTTLNTSLLLNWTFSAASTQQDNSQHKLVIELNVLCGKHSAGQRSIQACLAWLVLFNAELSPK